LEAGEFIRVGSSKVQKTDVRVITATNKDLLELTDRGRFREDLYYRLSTVPIRVPALRDRKEDISILFRKFAVDFAERYKSAPVQLDDEAKNLLINYSWPGNVRELKNIAEQISVLSQDKNVSAAQLNRFIPAGNTNRLPMIVSKNGTSQNEFANEREILYKLFFDMKKDVTELKKMFVEILKNPSVTSSLQHSPYANELKEFQPQEMFQPSMMQPITNSQPVVLQNQNHSPIHEHEEIEESLNIMDKEKELIIKALKKHKSKRKDAASDLGISERTLYRKLKEYNVEDL
jgi:DNA-binding NtrC family response regulator